MSLEFQGLSISFTTIPLLLFATLNRFTPVQQCQRTLTTV